MSKKDEQRRRVLGAKKGWAKRRARAHRRSEAARQGWVTRRANQKKAGKFFGRAAAQAEQRRRKARSEAAKKGWVTRRGIEYVLHFDYGSKRPRKGPSLIRFQIHLRGPRDASDAEAIAAGIAFDLGVENVEGWKFEVITWGHPPKPATNPWDENLSAAYYAAVDAGSKRVASRGATSQRGSIEP